MIFLIPQGDIPDKELKAIWIVLNLLSIVGAICLLLNLNNEAYYYHSPLDGTRIYFDPPIWMLGSFFVFCLTNGIAIFCLLIEMVLKYLK